MKVIKLQINKKVMIISISILLSVLVVGVGFASNIFGATNETKSEVNYSIQSDWGSGASINVTVKNNGSTSINNWSVSWTFPGNQKITNLWNGNFTQTDKQVTVKNTDWNSVIPAGGSISFGFSISYSGTNSIPTDFSVNNSTVVTSSPSVTSVQPTETITPIPSQTITNSITPTSTGLYPNYNTSPIAPDSTGMNSTSTQLAAKIKVGLNIGNTMEAIGGETNWGNPKISKELISLIKKNGFNAVRIPCSWDQYANSSTAEIKKEWLDRVKEVVKYCVDEDMYVILNIHWDGGWLENNCTEDKQVANNAKQKAFWEQIATQLRGFDEHLIFAGSNEPNVESATQMAVLNTYHQTFIDAVRSTGGKNSYRVLIIQGPSTDIEKTNKLMLNLPVDKLQNRLMAEIHYYSPYQFTLMTEDANWGKMFYYWGKNNHSTTDTDRNPTWGEEDYVDSMMKLMKTQFVDKGIPVIMGEFCAMKRTTLTGDSLALHLKSRAYFTEYITRKAKANGILPFYWDTGGLFNRSNNTLSDKQILDALINGSTN